MNILKTLQFFYRSETIMQYKQDIKILKTYSINIMLVQFVDSFRENCVLFLMYNFSYTGAKIKNLMKNFSAVRVQYYFTFFFNKIITNNLNVILNICKIPKLRKEHFLSTFRKYQQIFFAHWSLWGVHGCAVKSVYSVRKVLKRRSDRIGLFFFTQFYWFYWAFTSNLRAGLPTVRSSTLPGHPWGEMQPCPRCRLQKHHREQVSLFLWGTVVCIYGQVLLNLEGERRRPEQRWAKWRSTTLHLYINLRHFIVYL
jgi:hypothetical protein